MKNYKNKLILGTVQFGLDYGINNPDGKLKFLEVKRILDYAFENGIFFLDTALSYGNAHQVIGEYHKISDNVFKIITKYNTEIFNKGKSFLEYNIFETLKALRVESLECVMFHSFEAYINCPDELFNYLVYLKERKLIKYLGVSLYTNDEMKLVIDEKKIDLIQIPYNLLDNYVLRGNLINIAKSRNIIIHTRSVFLQGLFTLDENALPPYLSEFKPIISKIKKICKSDYSIPDLALNYVNNTLEIDQIVIGVNNIYQLIQNLNSINKGISSDQIKTIVFEMRK